MVSIARFCDLEWCNQNDGFRRRRIDSEEVLSADDSIDRESLKNKREVVEKYRVGTDMNISDDEVPEFTELPTSEDMDSN